MAGRNDRTLTDRLEWLQNLVALLLGLDLGVLDLLHAHSVLREPAWIISNNQPQQYLTTHSDDSLPRAGVMSTLINVRSGPFSCLSNATAMTALPPLHDRN